MFSFDLHMCRYHITQSPRINKFIAPAPLFVNKQVF